NNVFNVNGGAESASKKETSPLYRLMPPLGSALSRTINVAGLVGSFTGRNCVPGMLTVLGYVMSTWMPATGAELKVFTLGTSTVTTSTLPPAGQEVRGIVVEVVEVEVVDVVPGTEVLVVEVLEVEVEVDVVVVVWEVEVVVVELLDVLVV